MRRSLVLLPRLVWRAVQFVVPEHYHSRRDRLSDDADQLATTQQFRTGL